MIAIISSWISCKKEAPCVVPCESIVEAHPDAKDLFLFQAGSWIEYELLDSNLVDTMTIVKSRKWTSDNKCLDFDIYCQYVYDIEFEHSNLDYYPKDQYIGGTFVSKEIYQIQPFGGSWALLLSPVNKTSTTTGHVLSFPFELGVISGAGYTVTDTASGLQTAVGSMKTTEVKKTISGSQLPYSISSFNYARGIGLVQFTMHNGDVWRVKSYQVF